MNAGPLLDAVVAALVNSLRSRAEKVMLGGHDLWVAHLADIIASKAAAGRPRAQAVLLTILKRTLREKKS